MNRLIKYITHIIILLTAIALFSACTEIIDVELDENATNLLVVDAKITNRDTFHYARINRSISYFEEQAVPPELNAKVTISGGNKTYNLLDVDNDGVYVSELKFAGEIDVPYTLSITTADGKTFTAENTIKAVPPIDSVTYEYSNIILPFDREYRYYIFLHMQEPEGLGNYYLWNLYKNGELYTDTLDEQQFIFDENIDGNYLSYVNIFVLDDNEIEADNTEMILEMASISKTEYDFRISALFEAVWNQGLFQGPPANVTTNLSDGAVGFFSAQAIVSDTLVVRLKQ